jgi:hypothetical protein
MYSGKITRGSKEMKDFEVHPTLTRKEIIASRELAMAIKQITDQYGNGIVPLSVFQAYTKLLEVYKDQMADE